MINMFWSDEDLLLLGVIAAREADNRGWYKLVQNWKELYYKNKEELNAWGATAERSTSLAERANEQADEFSRLVDWFAGALKRTTIVAFLLSIGWLLTVVLFVI